MVSVSHVGICSALSPASYRYAEELSLPLSLAIELAAGQYKVHVQLLKQKDTFLTFSTFSCAGQKPAQLENISDKQPW